MRYFSILPLHAYGTVPQLCTSGPVAASAAHYTTLAVASQEVGRFVHKDYHLLVLWRGVRYFRGSMGLLSIHNPRLASRASFCVAA